ncbi:MAG: Appr-1-p processing protein [Myxococcales bacterium]|nr:MAG: Appr-1-p processing protein [Myxococcales bacterium]
MPITHVTGDATRPAGSDPRIIVHVCNDIGRWGAGFVVALSRRWREPEAAFRRWYRDRATSGFALGAVQLVAVEPTLWVANLVGQHGVARAGVTPADGLPPVRYEAIRAGLARVRDEARRRGASVHMPRIGCGLAGGRWETIEPIIDDELGQRGVAVTVYDLA